MPGHMRTFILMAALTALVMGMGWLIGGQGGAQFGQVCQRQVARQRQRPEGPRDPGPGLPQLDALAFPMAGNLPGAAGKIRLDAPAGVGLARAGAQQGGKAAHVRAPGRVKSCRARWRA